MEASMKQTQETTTVVAELETPPVMVSETTVAENQTNIEDIESAKDITTDQEKPKDTIETPPTGSEKENITSTDNSPAKNCDEIPNKNSAPSDDKSVGPTSEEMVETLKSNSEDKSVQTTAESANGKKSKKKDAASAEEKKLVDLLVHVFDGLDTPEKKMEALAKKYIQLAADMKTTENKLEDVENKHKEVKKEKDQIYSDFTKINMAKSKLESLCRELQKQNKIIKEEIQRRADEEDRKRRDLSQKFQTTINDITTQMGENHKRNQQLKQDNTDLAQKLKGLVEQYEVREQHIEKVLKAKQLELQLCEAKLQQQTLVLQEERQTNLKEKHAALQESLDQKKKVEMLVKQEAELKSQLALYTEKFVEFQSTLTKSNEVFATFKKEMDKMTKTIRKLEKESNTWKTRYENTNVSLLQMVEERTQKDNEISMQKGKIDKLEKLCRALQLERRKLKKEMEQSEKSNGSAVEKVPGAANGQEASNGKEDGDTPPVSPSPEVDCTKTNNDSTEEENSIGSSQETEQATVTSSDDVKNHDDAGSSNQNEVVHGNTTEVNNEQDQNKVKPSIDE